MVFVFELKNKLSKTIKKNTLTHIRKGLLWARLAMCVVAMIIDKQLLLLYIVFNCVTSSRGVRGVLCKNSHVKEEKEYD